MIDPTTKDETTAPTAEPTRRQFILMTVAGLGATILGVGCGDADGAAMEPMTEPDMDFEPDVDPTRLPEAALDLDAVIEAWIGDAPLDAVKAVGRAYIQRFEPDQEAVIADLSEIVMVFAEIAALEDALIAIDASSVEDFEELRMASVFGWQLGVTESRMCALADRLL